MDALPEISTSATLYCGPRVIVNVISSSPSDSSRVWGALASRYPCACR